MRISRYWSCASGVQRRERRPAACRAARRARRAAPPGRAHPRIEQALQRRAVERQRRSWPKPGSPAVSELLAEELPRHRPLRHRRPRQVGIEPLEQPRPPRRLGLAGPEAADLGLAEQVVAGEHLVGAFAGQHDLDAGVVHQLREQEQRRRRGAQDRPLGVGDDVGEDARDVAARHHHLVVIAAEMRRPSGAGSRSRRTRRPRSAARRSRTARPWRAGRARRRASCRGRRTDSCRPARRRAACAGWSRCSRPRARRRRRRRASRGSPSAASLGDTTDRRRGCRCTVPSR